MSNIIRTTKVSDMDEHVGQDRIGKANPVFVNHNAKVKHVVNLFSLVLDNYHMGYISHDHVMRPCESAECFKLNNMQVPQTKHLKIRTPSMIWYACLECGRQMHIEGTAELDDIEELSYEEQKFLAYDYASNRYSLNKLLRRKVDDYNRKKGD